MPVKKNNFFTFWQCWRFKELLGWHSEVGQRSECMLRGSFQIGLKIWEMPVKKCLKWQFCHILMLLKVKRSTQLNDLKWAEGLRKCKRGHLIYGQWMDKNFENSTFIIFWHCQRSKEVPNWTFQNLAEGPRVCWKGLSKLCQRSEEVPEVLKRLVMVK